VTDVIYVVLIAVSCIFLWSHSSVNVQKYAS